MFLFASKLYHGSHTLYKYLIEACGEPSERGISLIPFVFCANLGINFRSGDGVRKMTAKKWVLHTEKLHEPFML